MGFPSLPLAIRLQNSGSYPAALGVSRGLGAEHHEGRYHEGERELGDQQEEDAA